MAFFNFIYKRREIYTIIIFENLNFINHNAPINIGIEHQIIGTVVKYENKINESIDNKYIDQNIINNYSNKNIENYENNNSNNNVNNIYNKNSNNFLIILIILIII